MLGNLGLPARWASDLDAPSRAGTLARGAYDALRHAISHRMLVPNTLYSEAQLAKVLDVSRTPVREALIELSREGVVEKVPQRGFRLRIPTPQQIDEAYALRGLIESYVVRRLIENGSLAVIEHLRSVVDREAAVLARPDAVPEIGYEFHLAMPLALGLEHCHRALVMLRPSLWLSYVREEGSDFEPTKEHRELVELIASRDTTAAVSSVVEHIERARLARHSWDTVRS
jgi:DNA-binding GntR family transcriptional regulator